ncbi:MAG TPA: hypothetical protein VML19_00525 [Verrucomicrobiae bacterium]|nr:hypothetical protein [Verrucomicrobiae bacterium]
MSPRAAAFLSTPLFLLVILLTAASNPKTIATATGENDDLIITMTLHIDPAEFKDAVGSDLGGHFVMAEVKVAPKYGKTITVTRDDFQLLDTDHNDKSRPFAANQIVGPALVIQRGPDDTADDKKKDTAKGKNRPKPTITGPIMTSPGVKINPPLDPAKAKSHEDGAAKDTPLEKSLDEKMLPEGATDKPAEGLLFFALEKVKMKDMQLTYGGRDNRIVLKFK